MSTLRVRIVERIAREMQLRDLSEEELADKCGFKTPRTVHRLLTLETFSIETVERVEEVLNVRLVDNDCRETFQSELKRSELFHDSTWKPVVGWEQAAIHLGVARNTIWRARARTGDRRYPWWESVEALRSWYATIVPIPIRKGRPPTRPASAKVTR